MYMIYAVLKPIRVLETPQVLQICYNVCSTKYPEELRMPPNASQLKTSSNKQHQPVPDQAYLHDSQRWIHRAQALWPLNRLYHPLPPFVLEHPPRLRFGYCS